MKEMFSLQDKVVVITGAGGVLCGAMAKAVAKAGAKVAVCDLLEEAAKKVVDEIKNDGDRAIAVKCNVLQKDTLEAAKNIINAQFGPIDILINGAGGNKKEATTSPDISFFNLPADAIRFVFELYFTEQVSPDLEMPMWLVYMGLPIGSSLMCFRFLQVCWKFIRTGEFPRPDHAKVEGLDQGADPIMAAIEKDEQLRMGGKS